MLKQIIRTGSAAAIALALSVSGANAEDFKAENPQCIAPSKACLSQFYRDRFCHGSDAALRMVSAKTRLFNIHSICNCLFNVAPRNKTTLVIGDRGINFRRHLYRISFDTWIISG